VLVSAVSRLVHPMGGGVRDIALPLTGNSGIEPRRDGSGNYTVIMTFDQPVTAGSVNTTAGTGNVSNVSYTGNDMIVTLSGVTDQQSLAVAANNVSGTNTQTTSVSVRVGFLQGDVNRDHVVNVGDTVPTRSHAGQVLDNTNFQYDVNVDGQIDAGDTVIVRSKSGNYVP
jgi:hypothetical protein